MLPEWYRSSARGPPLQRCGRSISTTDVLRPMSIVFYTKRESTVRSYRRHTGARIPDTHRSRTSVCREYHAQQQGGAGNKIRFRTGKPVCSKHRFAAPGHFIQGTIQPNERRFGNRTLSFPAGPCCVSRNRRDDAPPHPPGSVSCSHRTTKRPGSVPGRFSFAFVKSSSCLRQSPNKFASAPAFRKRSLPCSRFPASAKPEQVRLCSRLIENVSLPCTR